MKMQYNYSDYSYTDFKIAILLPAHNEEKTIQAAICDFHTEIPSAQIVVIDNQSCDKTKKIAEETLFRLQGTNASQCKGRVLSESRKGKANALRKAFHEINADIYIMCDADSTYAARDIHALLMPILREEAELVVGNRHADSAYQKQNTRRFHNLGNNLVKRLINFLFRCKLQDIMSGYRVMSNRFVKNFPLLSEGFEVETEMTLHAINKRFQIMEIPIAYQNRPEGSSSKLNTFKDGLRVLKIIFWIFKDFKPLFFFGACSGFFFTVGILVGIPVIIDFMHTGLVPKFPSAILASGLMVFSLLFFAIGLILDTVTEYHCSQYELNLLTNYCGPFSWHSKMLRKQSETLWNDSVNNLQKPLEINRNNI